MAVLAHQDWHLPKDHASVMDSSPSNAPTSPVPRQHPASSNPNPVSAPHLPPQQQYPYPVQQQPSGWTPNHSAPPFYPSFYQNPQQHSPYGHPSHPQQSHLPPQNPYYDHAANHQFAQWAYQQMMFNAQQGHQLPHFSPLPSQQGSQRGRSGSSNAQQDYLVQNPAFHPFPSGTPPPSNFSRSSSTDSSQMYNGFHPYRRPDRQQKRDPSQSVPQPDWRSGAAGPFQPPYARNDASGSSTSVNSVSSQSSRHRTNSFQGSAASNGNGNGSNNSHQQTNRLTPASAPPRANSNGSSIATSTSNPATTPRPHYRTSSSSSTSSNSVRIPSTSPSAGPSSPVVSQSTTASQAPLPRPSKPSPLSQGNFTAAEKRVSRDDSDLATMMESTPTVSTARSGLKGRLRRALSFNAANVLQEEEEVDRISSTGKASQKKQAIVANKSQGLTDDSDPAPPGPKKKSRTALFNSRLNASTDNISLSSTMSSASMVIRKLGNIGKLTRRNSLAGITSLFKDKKDKEDGEEGKSKKKKGVKGAAAEASVSHVTAELDRSEWSAELNGLSPAARLARQHTLKSNAEAAAKAKVAQEPTVSAASAGETGSFASTWEKNTTNRQGEGTLVNGFISEEGTRVVVEENDGSGSDDDQVGGISYQHDHSGSLEGWDDTEDWGEEDEDVTIRGGVESLNLDQEDHFDMEPWAVDVRRSLEKKRIPMKGILKSSVYTPTDQPSIRTRSNSYNSAPSQPSELGPLARIPSSDPDHIDGLYNHSPHVSAPSPSSPFLPVLSFQSKDQSDNLVSPLPHHEKMMFSHSNSSAPALSTMFSSNPPTLSHRSATAPVKRLAFAANLSVYDTFPPSVYDRRSEPATWSRLTPALAQRIKEELNSYKMEEMEVHASSRIHTQFFV